MGSTRRLSFAALTAATAIALSCSSESSGPSGGRVAAVNLEPKTATLSLGATLPLQAAAVDADGNILAGRQIFFASNDQAVATVDANGVVTARSLGNAQIAASSEGQSAIAAITVTQRPVATVTVLPGSAQTALGGSVQLSAATFDSDGNLLSGRPVLWSSSNTAVATVDAQGNVQGRGLGNATISATSEGKSGSSTVTVTLVPVFSVSVTPASSTVGTGAQTQLTAVTLDAAGNVLNGRAIAWSAAPSDVASVTGTGLVSGLKAGTAVITATSEGKSGTAVVTVTPSAPPPPPPPPTIAKVRISPRNWKPRPGESLQFTARALDANDVEIQGVTFTWTSTNILRVTVSQTGNAIALLRGSADIIVSAGGKSDKADVDVQ